MFLPHHLVKRARSHTYRERRGWCGLRKLKIIHPAIVSITPDGLCLEGVRLAIVLYRRIQSAVNGETVNETTDSAPWGRVDESNNVYVREGDSERMVGQFPDGNAEEALAYFTRKFDDLAGQVHLLEQRINSGSAGLDVTRSFEHLALPLKAPAA